MQIQPAFSTGPATGAQGVNFPTNSGGTSPGAADGVRADWNVRMNVSHETGFVGGAGRMLIHNQIAEERTEIVLYLPAARSDQPGRLELASAVVCSAKPGTTATAGQNLAFRVEGAEVTVTVPLLKLNDWIYIDLTWTGGFPPGGMAFQGGQVPLGNFHPQVAVRVPQEDGRKGLFPIPSRYDVELGSDPGAVVRLESEGFGKVVSRSGDDGKMTMHEFKSYGKPQIQAVLAPPGAIVQPGAAVMEQPTNAVSTTPSLDADQPSFNR